MSVPSIEQDMPGPSASHHTARESEELNLWTKWLQQEHALFVGSAHPRQVLSVSYKGGGVSQQKDDGIQYGDVCGKIRPYWNRNLTATVITLNEAGASWECPLRVADLVPVQHGTDTACKLTSVC